MHTKNIFACAVELYEWHDIQCNWVRFTYNSNIEFKDFKLFKLTVVNSLNLYSILSWQADNQH